MARAWLLALVLLGVLAGCADMAKLAAALNERQVKGCGVITGAYGPFVTAKIDVLTGGMTVEECNTLR